MTGTATRSVIVGLLLLSFRPEAAEAQNGLSFSGAAASSIDYELPSAHPIRSCESLVALTGYEYSIVSAILVPTADEVPEHCRVSGVIPSEIRFEVNLPTGWNRRFYMHGNGGFAGLPPEAPSEPRHGVRHCGTGSRRPTRTRDTTVGWSRSPPSLTTTSPR